MSVFRSSARRAATAAGLFADVPSPSPAPVPMFQYGHLHLPSTWTIRGITVPRVVTVAAGALVFAGLVLAFLAGTPVAALVLASSSVLAAFTVVTWKSRQRARRVQRLRENAREWLPPITCTDDILAAVDFYMFIDDEAQGVPVPADDALDARLVPYYASIIEHLATEARDACATGREYARCSDAIMGLYARWGGPRTEFALEQEHYFAYGDEQLAWIRNESGSDGTRP